MKKFSCIIQNANGVHARIAGLLMKEALKYKSKIILSANGKKADAIQILLIMDMDIKSKQAVDVEISGEDEEIVYKAMKSFFQSNL